MKAEIDDNSQIITVWLKKAENTEDIIDDIKKYRNNHRIVIFHSGSNDIFNSTNSLLRHNRQNDS